MTFNDAEVRFLTRQPRGHLATLGPNRLPQVKPLGFTYNQTLGTIDIAGFNMTGSAKYHNVQVHPNVAFVVDEVTEDSMEGAHFLEVRGLAETTVGAHDLQGHLRPRSSGSIPVASSRSTSIRITLDSPPETSRQPILAKAVA